MHPVSAKSHHKIPAVVVMAIWLTIAGLALYLPRFLEFVVTSGNHRFAFPGKNLEIDYMLGILWAVVLGVGIYFWPVSREDTRALLRIWVLKVFVALFLMLWSEYIYGLDPDGYYWGAITLPFTWENIGFGNGTYNIHHLVRLHTYIVPDSYHAAKIAFAYISFFAIYLQYRAAVIFLGRGDLRILYFLALFPTNLYWSSFLGKDPITLLGISLYVYGVVALYRLRTPRYLLYFCLGLFILSMIRMWLVLMMVAPLPILVVMGRGSLRLRIALMGLCVIAFIGVMPKIISLWAISGISDLFDFRDYAIGAFAGGGSTIQAPVISSFGGGMIQLPLGLFTALFRPLPWDIDNFFGRLQSLDNLFLIFLLIRAVIRIRWAELKEPIVLWAVSLVLIWGSVYGLVSYNFGTLARYKLQILSVLLLILLYLGRRREGAI